MAVQVEVRCESCSMERTGTVNMLGEKLVIYISDECPACAATRKIQETMDDWLDEEALLSYIEGSRHFSDDDPNGYVSEAFNAAHGDAWTRDEMFYAGYHHKYREPF